MCVQCMMGATTAVGAASGARSWLATRRWAWLTPQRLHRITLALVLNGRLTGRRGRSLTGPVQGDPSRPGDRRHPAQRGKTPVSSR